MPGKHIFDPDFINSSKELKKVLTGFDDIEFDDCLDIPCGTGRNIFLLASYFKNVVGTDINQSYLDDVKTNLQEYRIKGSVYTERIDLLHETPIEIDTFSFIANIHYYNYSLSIKLIENMKVGALIFIETPGCAGANYKQLPTEKEARSLFKNMDILFYKPTTCKPANININSIAFKTLLRKKIMTAAALTTKTRKFKDQGFYNSQESNNYFLLSFKFHRLTDKKEVLVNEVGDHLVVAAGTVSRIVLKKISKETDPILFGDLVANFFISEKNIPPLIDVFATRYRTKKSFLDHFTTLHIFVVSLRCEHTCHYCQVSRVTQNKDKYDMSRGHIDKGIDLMLQSPSPHITMEFQGGEALLAFENIVYAVERTKELSKIHHKEVTYVICTNLALINEEILTYCKCNDILISTSLDGPAFVHNKNRTRPGQNSYELAIKGIELSRSILGKSRVSALMTTTNLSLEHPIEIVEEYYKQGFRSMFLRPISPYGFAIKNEQKNKYETNNFLAFYKKALGRILAYNLNGEFFSEDYATIILRKILTPFPVGYVDLNSPTGAITNVIAFNYDGAIYASDESRMLAEMKNYDFQLGHLDTHSYEDIFYGKKAREIVNAGINESLPGCSDCAFQSYCGADPIHNHATQGDMYGYRPTNTFCQKNMEIIRYLIELMDSDQGIKKIFESWVKPRY